MDFIRKVESKLSNKPDEINVEPTIVLIDTKYCQSQPITLVLREKVTSISEDDFVITDGKDRAWFKLDAKVASIRDKRTLYDPENQPVVTMRKKLLSLSGNKWEGVSASGKVVYTFEPKLISLVPHVDVYLKDGDKQPDFKISGSLKQKDFKIVDVRDGKDRLIAECSKTRFYEDIVAYAKKVMFDKHQYYARIQAGVDVAFITSMCLLLDEVYHDTEE